MTTLKEALQEACYMELEELPSEEALRAEEALTFSAAFERGMKKLIRRANHPIRHRMLKSAACFLLAVLLGSGILLTFSIEARSTIVSLLSAPANTASFTLWAAPGMLGNERVYTQTVTADATGVNRIDISVNKFITDGSGNVYATCMSHTTKTPAAFTRIGTQTIVVTGDVVRGTPMTVEVSLRNVVAAETIRVSGTVG